jgi:hypothetical protein
VDGGSEAVDIGAGRETHCALGKISKNGLVWCTLYHFVVRPSCHHVTIEILIQGYLVIAKQNENTMNQQSNKQTKNKTRVNFWLAVAMLLLSGMLAGCTRPGDADVSRLMNNTYACKHTEIIELVKTDSLPGIYSYVAQYTFQVRFKEGEAGAIKFYKELFAEAEVKGTDWEQWMKDEKVQDYLGDECTESAQIVLERMVEYVLPQMAEKKETVRLPLVMPMLGWSEYMPGRKGWDITMRRDRVGGEPLMSEPIKRELLLVKKDDKAAKGKKK